jgi:hypothetical protein
MSAELGKFDKIPGADLVITARVGDFLEMLDEAEPEWVKGFIAGTVVGVVA